MQAVAVSRFHDHIVSFRDILGVFDNRLVGIADITAENDFARLPVFRQPELNAG